MTEMTISNGVRGGEGRGGEGREEGEEGNNPSF